MVCDMEFIKLGILLKNCRRKVNSGWLYIEVLKDEHE